MAVLRKRKGGFFINFRYQQSMGTFDSMLGYTLIKERLCNKITSILNIIEEYMHENDGRRNNYMYVHFLL